MFGGVGAFVVCFGEGGHLAIEFAHEGGHDHSSNHMEGFEAVRHDAISGDACNPCFDIPLTADRTDPHTTSRDTAGAAASLDSDSMLAASVVADRPYADHTVLSRVSPPPSRHFLEVLETTVLRT
jgi:hypothetical protein